MEGRARARAARELQLEYGSVDEEGRPVPIDWDDWEHQHPVPESRLADNDATGQAPAAMNNLGLLLAEHGDVEGARAAYQRAIDTGHPDQAPAAMNNLGLMLAEHGNVEGARAAFQRAIDTGHPDQAPIAMNNLGVVQAE